jgi:hypothetical protein
MTKDLVGQMVRLTFTGMGEKRKGKNPAYLYELEHDPANTIEVSGDVNTSESEPDEGSDDSYDAVAAVEEDETPAPLPVTTRTATPTSVSAQARIQALINSRKGAVT